MQKESEVIIDSALWTETASLCTIYDTLFSGGRLELSLRNMS